MIVEEIVELKSSSPQPSLKDKLSEKKLAIYGVGQGFLTYKTFVLDKFDITVDLFVDIQFKTSTKFNGAIGINPNKLSEIDVSDYTVVVTTAVSSFKRIHNQLNEYFGENIYSAFEFYEYHLAYADKSVINDGCITLQTKFKMHISSFDKKQDYFRQLALIFRGT